MNYTENDLEEIRKNEKKVKIYEKCKKITKMVITIIVLIAVIWFFVEADKNPDNDAFGWALIFFGPIFAFFVFIIYFIFNSFYKIMIKKYNNNINRINDKYFSK